MAKIAIIDDDQDIIDNLTMILTGNGHSVEVIMDTDNVVEKVKFVCPNLVILDIMFPEDSQAGFKAARALRKDQATRQLPILIFSAVNQRSNLSFSFSENDTGTSFMPAEAFIDKPVEPHVLIERINQLLDTHSG